MGGTPFFWRHLIILLCVAANFVLSVAIVRKTGSSFRSSALLRSVALRSVSVAYLTGSLVVLLAAIALFAEIETGEHAARCWAVHRAWSTVRPGMTPPQVVELLGKPKEVRFEEHYLYQLHPLWGAHEGAVSFSGASADGTLASNAKVVHKSPETEPDWIPPGAARSFRSAITENALVISALLLPVVAVVSLIPFRLRAGASAWILYPRWPRCSWGRFMKAR